MPNFERLPIGITLFVAIWAAAAPVAWLLGGQAGVLALTAAAATVGLAGLVSHRLTHLACRNCESPVLTLAVGTGARTFLVFALLVFAFELGSTEDNATMRLFGCCVLPFYFALLAREILSAKPRSNPSIVADAPSINANAS